MGCAGGRGIESILAFWAEGIYVYVAYVTRETKKSTMVLLGVRGLICASKNAMSFPWTEWCSLALHRTFSINSTPKSSGQ